MSLLQQTLDAVPPVDNAAMEHAIQHINTLTMPHWALGRLCDLGVRLAGITGRVPPLPLRRRCVAVMAGDHGVTARGVSIHPQDVTQQMAANIANGGAGVNVIARINRADVVIADLGMARRDEELIAQGLLWDYSLGQGTADMSLGPAMTPDQARASLEAGIAIARRLSPDYDALATGEMGIGNSTPATAVAAALTGVPVPNLCGAGAGLDAKGIEHKAKIIQQALTVNKPDPENALDVLAKVGGFEIGAIAGLILGAAAVRLPVLVDGFISTAGAMLARALCPPALEYAFLAHASAEPGHTIMCRWLGQEPLLRLDMRLGEGSGAALAFPLLDAAIGIMGEMATFESAGVDAAGREQ